MQEPVLLLPVALPPQHQGLADRHGHVAEDGEEAGELLQRHHLQQQAHRRLRASSPEGNQNTRAAAKLMCKQQEKQGRGTLTLLV